VRRKICPSEIAGVALLGSPDHSSPNLQLRRVGAKRAVVTPFRLVTYNRRRPSPPSPKLSPPSSRSIHRTFPGLTFHALGRPWSRVDEEDVSTHDHAGANPLRLFLSSHSRWKWVTSPAPPSLKPNVGPLTDPENATADFAGDHRRRIHQISQWFRQSLAKPQAGTGLGIAGDQLREHAAKDLILAADPGNDGRTPRAPISFQEGFRTAGIIVFPEQFAGLEVKRSQKGPPHPDRSSDDLPAMEDRGGNRSHIITITHFTEVRFPKFFAVEVVAKDPGRAVPDNHARAVSRVAWTRSKDSMGTSAQLWETQLSAPKVPCPFGGRSNTGSLLTRVFRTSDKDAPMRNDGAAVTRTWECRFPADVIRRSPMERRFVLLSDTIPERPAELRPIPCPHCQGQPARQAQQQSEKNNTEIHVQGEAPEFDDSVPRFRG